MASIVYLEADDEITSAAARIRTAPQARVGLVVPYGSRLATSRINFRLLAREAQSRERRLSIVAADAATRALAASAGLPVFGSVGEYEDAEAGAEAAGGRRSPAAAAAPSPGVAEPSSRPKGAGGAPPSRRKRAAPKPAASDGNGVADDLDGTTMMPAVAGAAAAGAAAAGTVRAAGTASAARGSAGGASAIEAGTRPTATFPVTAGLRRLEWPFGRTAGIAVAGAVALVLLAAGVAAYLLLPNADITLTTRMERIGPVPLDIRADPVATAPDPALGIIPAERLSFELAASATFPSTGKRTLSNFARGQVTFLSKDPISENPIGAGAVVSTPNGIRFETTDPIVIPPATIVGLTIVPGEASVAIKAVGAGPAGNVEANAITVIPSGEDPTFTEVRNPEPTTGGRRRVFPRVDQADVDAALQQLRAQLDADFAAGLADPTRVPAGMRLFPETQALSEPVPTVDPASLVDQELQEFQLGLSATGTIVAVDPGPVDEMARQRIAGSVDRGYRLVDGSIETTAGEPVVEGEIVHFPISASAAQIRNVDAEALRDEIKGKPIPQAREILEQYGLVEIRAWPEWVTTIPTNDGRVTLRVVSPTGAGASPRPSGSTTPSAPASRAPASGPPPSAAPGSQPAGSAGTEADVESAAPPP